MEELTTPVNVDRYLGQSETEERIMDLLDTHGAPPGKTVEERLRLWAERERTKERYVAWVDKLQWRLREDGRR